MSSSWRDLKLRGLLSLMILQSASATPVPCECVIAIEVVPVDRPKDGMNVSPSNPVVQIGDGQIQAHIPSSESPSTVLTTKTYLGPGPPPFASRTVTSYIEVTTPVESTEIYTPTITVTPVVLQSTTTLSTVVTSAIPIVLASPADPGLAITSTGFMSSAGLETTSTLIRSASSADPQVTSTQLLSSINLDTTSISIQPVASANSEVMSMSTQLASMAGPATSSTLVQLVSAAVPASSSTSIQLISVADPGTMSMSIQLSSSAGSATPSTSSLLAVTASSASSSTLTQLVSSTIAALSTSVQLVSSTSATSSTSIQLVTKTVADTALTSLTTSAIQSPTQAIPTNTIGSLHTSLETSGNVATLPFATSIATATSPLSLVSSFSVTPTASISATSIDVNNIFRPMASDAPPAQIGQRSDHPVSRSNILAQRKTLETNKFYANLFLGSQTSPVYTYPYALAWVKGRGQGGIVSWGMSIAHSEQSQYGFGPAEAITGAASYYTNPIGIQSIILSATQLGNETSLTTDSLAGFSVNANLLAAGSSSPTITFPLVQGMGFITALYNGGATPLIDSGVGIKNVTYSGIVAGSTAHKYRFTLADSTTWLIYIYTQDSTYPANSFTIISPNRVQGPSGFTGYIQVAKLPSTSSTSPELVYDTATGAYPVSGGISGTVSGTTGAYNLAWSKAGDTSRSLLMFALPHHVTSMSSTTSALLTGIELQTPTKGEATAVLADSWTLVEAELPISMAFAPWSPISRESLVDISDHAQDLVIQAATSELAQKVHEQTDLDSMYFSGKGLAKFAAIVYAVHDMAHNATLALTGLQKLESAFAVFVNNQQINPLAYDTVWGGVVSSASYGGNLGLDFGNTLYNDHHFHYGYFVYSAAVIAYLDPTWLNTTNRAWVDLLVRDYANPAESDPYFPFSRSFDWYHGHSWAKGLFESADGKDQESSSEDTMASYALKMWGKITGDTAMEARGNLMLAVQARSLADYYLYTSDNNIEPASFIKNKAAGIMFENKIDHATYFGTALEDIEGIHMIPIMPFSTLTRRAAFVTEEWNTYFLSYASTVTSGWRGILMANLAIIDPSTSFNFFANSSGTFTSGMLDGGASQTWYLAYSAALGGSTGYSSTNKRNAKEVHVKDGKVSIEE